MGKKDLGALEVNRLVKQGVPGRYRVGKNLYIQVRETGAASWLFRYTLDGRVIGKTRNDKPKRNGAHWMGLGSFNRFSLDEANGRKPLSLNEARQKARQQGQKLTDYIDPLAAKRKALTDRTAAQAKNITFRECARQYLAAHESDWKNAKHAKQWSATLETYAFPAIGNMLVADIDEAHLVRVLQPIWQTIPETARRLRGRIESVLGYATVSKFRSGDNPARWRNHLQTLLGGTAKTVKHHPALPYKQIAEFMTELRQQNGIAARALEYTILTAARTGDIIGGERDAKPPMLWSHVDPLSARVWTIPSTKTDTEHHVPLSSEAITLLTNMRRQHPNGAFVLPGGAQQPLSNMAMAEVIKRMNEKRAARGLPLFTDPKQNNAPVTVHGFRSTFRDWVGERTNYPGEMAEMALAHKVPDKVEAAYRRGTLLEKRKRLMADWAAYCMSPPVVDDSNVSQFPRRGRAS
jgi:integrase